MTASRPLLSVHARVRTHAYMCTRAHKYTHSHTRAQVDLLRESSERAARMDKLIADDLRAAIKVWAKPRRQGATALEGACTFAVLRGGCTEEDCPVCVPCCWLPARQFLKG